MAALAWGKAPPVGLEGLLVQPQQGAVHFSFQSQHVVLLLRRLRRHGIIARHPALLHRELAAVRLGRIGTRRRTWGYAHLWPVAALGQRCPCLADVEALPAGEKKETRVSESQV